MMKNSLIHSFFLMVVSILANFSNAQERGAVPLNAGSDNDQVKTVHSLVIGVSDYQEVPSLNYADNDADLIDGILSTNFAGNQGMQIKLTNQEASEFAILSSILKLNRTIQEGDLFVMYLAGHGDVAFGIDGTEQGYFLAYNASGSREYALGGSVSFEQINKFINGLTSKGVEVWLITDACRSGKIINAEGASATMAAIIKGYENTTKFISCQSNELSYEYDSLAHGAFTYYLAKGLAGEADQLEVDGELSVKELEDYLAMNVRSATQKRQTPSIYSADRYRNLMPANEAFLSFIKSADEMKNNLAMNGRGSDDELSTKEDIIIRFEDALVANNIYAGNESAYSIYQSYLNQQDFNESDAEYMSMMLVNKLMQRTQEQINIFLSDRPTLQKSQDFKQAKKDLNYVLDLLGEEHPYYAKMKGRYDFFTAMNIIHEKDHTRYGEAEEILIDLKQKEPNSAYVNQGLAHLYIATNQKQKAENELDSAKEKIKTWQKPENSKVHLKIVTGQLDQAIELIEKGEESGIEKDHLLFLKTELYTANNQLQKAEEELSKMNFETSNYSSSERFQMEAQINTLRGRIKKAEEYYLKAIEQDKNNESLLLKLAALYRDDLDTAKALAAYNKVLSINPDNLTAKNNLAILNSASEAEINININYYDEDEVSALIYQLVVKSNQKEAQKVLEKAKKYAKWNAEYYYLEGLVLNSSEELNEACKAWETALKLNKFHIKSAEALILAQIKLGNTKRAEELIVQHNKNFAGSADWQTLKFRAYSMINPGDDHSSILSEAQSLDPKNVKVYEWMYRLNLKSSNYDEALSNFSRIQELGGGNLDSTEFLNAVILQFEKDVNMARQLQSLNGLKVIDLFDNKYVVKPVIDARRSYYKMDYRQALIHLNNFKRYLFILGKGDKVYHHRLLGFVLLEMGNYDEAIDMFKYVNSNSTKTEYTGLSMALYEKGAAEGLWKQYFKQDKYLFEFNRAGQERFRRMNMAAGYQSNPRR